MKPNPGTMISPHAETGEPQLLGERKQDGMRKRLRRGGERALAGLCKAGHVALLSTHLSRFTLGGRFIPFFSLTFCCVPWPVRDESPASRCRDKGCSSLFPTRLSYQMPVLTPSYALGMDRHPPSWIPMPFSHPLPRPSCPSWSVTHAVSFPDPESARESPL